MEKQQAATMKVIQQKIEETTLIVDFPSQEGPLKVPPRLKSGPKIRELYWCDFPRDAQLPELWKTRVALIVSFRNGLYGTATVLPCTGRDQEGNKWAYKLPRTIDGERSWALCDKPTTFAVSRLSIGRNGIIRLSEIEYQPALDLMLAWVTPGQRK